MATSVWEVWDDKKNINIAYCATPELAKTQADKCVEKGMEVTVFENVVCETEEDLENFGGLE